MVAPQGSESSEKQIRSHTRARLVAHIPLLAMLVVVALLFRPALDTAFVNWDDDRFIVNNPAFAGAWADYVWLAVSRIQFEAYQPLHLLSYAIDKLLWPTNAVGFRLLSLTLYLGACSMLWLLLKRPVPAVVASVAVLVFALHPMRAESVVWISARKDVLALIFLLGVLLLEDARLPNSQTGVLKRTALSVFLGICAILSKSATIVIPLIVFAWHVWMRKERFVVAAKRAAPHAVAALAAAGLVMFLWQKSRLIWPERPLPLLLDVPATIGFYVQKTLFPANLAPIYPPVAPGHTWLAIGWFLGVVAVIVWWRKLPEPLRFGVFAFHAALIPVSNVVPLYFRYADRYSIFAHLVLTVPVAAGLGCLWSNVKRRSVVAALIGIVLLFQGLVTARLARAWGDSIQLWESATAAQPEAMFGHLKLAEAQTKRGQHYDAIASYLSAAQIKPRSLIALAGLFTATSTYVESTGQIPKGSTELWQSRLKAIRRAADFEVLLRDVENSGCERCAQTLLWLGLYMFPQTTEQLAALAQEAISKGQKLAAEIYLRELSLRKPLSHQK